MNVIMKLSRNIITLVLSCFLFGVSSCSAEKEKKMDSSNSQENIEHKHTNHLAGENSPYLLAHAHNPVDWYPWGDEALAKAKSEDKPIFLSIGYSACHWCHVMERESFENEAIAKVLNENFISIKVDREQRPDLDQIYMSFTTAMTGRGGWPMSVFLTPNLKPFYAGTYFPPDDRYGRPGFMNILNKISNAFKTDRTNIEESSHSIFRKLSLTINQSGLKNVIVNEQMISRGAEALYRNFDHINGGFGGAPKFPHAVELSLFLRMYKKTGDRKYLIAGEKGLMSMARGGIYDHLGGGFARYSTDAKWLVPHFEKMLYDNALLVPVYAEAYQITKNKYYLKVIRETLDYLIREMTDKNGGIYSALDADSEGEEGKFYVWSYQEAQKILGSKNTDNFFKYYNISPAGNWEGHSILNVNKQSDLVASSIPADELEPYLSKNKKLLFDERAKRIRPLTDDKILSSWNGLALSAFAVGYQVTGDKKYLEVAIKNAEFVKETLFDNNKLTHSYREGKHSDGEFLEDYSFYIRGLLDLYQSDNGADNDKWLTFAEALATNASTLFMDEKGTLYLRPAGDQQLIFRPKDETDGAIPAPGSFLISSWFKLHRLTGDEKYLNSANKALNAVSGMIEQNPNAMTSALLAVDFYLSDKIEIVIVGVGEERDKILKSVYEKFYPNKLIAISKDGNEKRELFEGRKATKNTVSVYLCRNSVCNLPVSTAKELEIQLNDL